VRIIRGGKWEGWRDEYFKEGRGIKGMGGGGRKGNRGENWEGEGGGVVKGGDMRKGICLGREKIEKGGGGGMKGREGGN
jgi:hypothetical protein